MKKILLITISLSIAYWGALWSMEDPWVLPLPFLIIVTIWYLDSDYNKTFQKYKLIQSNDKYGILRTSDKQMLVMVDDSIINFWHSSEEKQAQYCYTEDKEKVERFLEQLNSN
jgi:hypothetical protein